MYIYVLVYIFVLYIYKYVCVHIYIYIHMFHARRLFCMYIQTRENVHTGQHTHMHAHSLHTRPVAHITQSKIYICIFMCMYTYTYISAYWPCRQWEKQMKKAYMYTYNYPWIDVYRHTKQMYADTRNEDTLHTWPVARIIRLYMRDVSFTTGLFLSFTTSIGKYT